MSTFVTNRNLLNPKFDGYKLSPLDEAEHVSRFALKNRPTQANVSGKSKVPLSFEEVQARIKHNHLAIARDSRSAAYVDKDMNVCTIMVDESFAVTTEVVCSLPQAIETDEVKENIHKEYPRILSLDDAWLVSDGAGTLCILKQDEWRIAASYSLSLDSDVSGFEVPFQLHDAHASADGIVSCILSCRHSGVDAEGAARTKAQPVHFDVVLAQLSLSASSDEMQKLKIIWRGRGTDIPIHVSFDTTRDSFVVLGSSAYRALNAPTPPSYEPTSDELAPIPRANESTDPPSRPPPYSWTQTPDSVTIAFALPSNVPKSAIHVTMTAQTLSLLVKHELPTSASLPRYALKQLWDGINASSSFWTWDREADKHFGLLTLHLDKQHESTRWSQVFASAGSKTEDAEVEVPETLDPSELRNIRESLEKYTAALQTGEDASGLGLGTGVPSLAEGEMDESVDASVGRKAVVTWIGLDGSGSDTSSEPPVSLLSLPLPGQSTDRPSVVIQNDIDGVLFGLPECASAADDKRTWEHKATFSALAFVLASKRDTRFVFHAGSSAVLAFESGSSLGGGNVFIYHGSKRGDTTARQAVLKVSGGASGPLLGVGILTANDGKQLLLCLCEQELVSLREIL